MSSNFPFRYPPDFADRYILPDVYPRRSDPYAPVSVIQAPSGTNTGLADTGTAPASADVYSNNTTPGVRPIVYQRGMNYQITAQTTPVALIQGQFVCDGIVIDVASTASNSVFFGFGSGITTGSGIEIRPGLPILFAPDNTREQWELQRILEQIAVILSNQTGYPQLQAFRAPRVVINANDWYVVAAAAQAVSIMLLTVPEFQ